MEISIGQRIRELRLEAKIGLRAFANRIGIPANTLSQIENDRIHRPNHDTIERIFELLGRELGKDKDVLMLEVGKLPRHAIRAIKKDPQSAANFFRKAPKKRKR